MNLQKLRIDQFEALVDGEKPKPLGFKLNQLLARKDVFPLLLQQTRTSWLRAEVPFCIIFDSFSDLTDQEFYGAGGIRFFAAYSDVSISDCNEAGISNCGLLDLENYELALKRVVTKLRQHYKATVPVVYIHFPSQLESRSQFIERAKLLADVTERLEGDLENFFSIEADPNLVRRADDARDVFPYHYHPDVARDLMNKLELMLGSDQHKLF